jgi:hypothetical protein
LAVVVVFYDAPTQSGVFDDFLAIPAFEGNVSTISFSDFVEEGYRAASNDIRLVVLPDARVR